MMPGMIMLWHGTIATIPSGWHLCDGSVGTPDLRNRFIVCANQDDAGEAKYNIKGWLQQSENLNAHTHVFTGDGHAHSLDGGLSISSDGAPNTIDHNTSTEPATGETEAAYHIPPCYCLCYIMKL